MKKFLEMMKQVQHDKYLTALWILCGIALFFYVGHFGSILIDFGREVYYPVRILEGKVLYKDLFVIYGPFSYFLNALLFKIMGINLKTLYFAGIFCSFAIITGNFLIAREFLSEFLSFCIGVLTITVGVATSVLFNFSFPYSWAMLYGTVCFLYSVLFLVKYKRGGRQEFLYLSAFLAGVCVTCKYEFAAYGLIFLVFARSWKALAAFAAAPVLSFGVLFLQGLSLSDLSASLHIVKKMAQTQTLKYFYQTVGVYFHPKVVLILAKTFMTAAVSFLSLFLYYKKKWLIVPAIALCAWALTGTLNLTLVFLPILIFVFAAASFEKFKTDIALLFLVLSAIVVSLKSFWGLLLLSYASYYAGFALIALLALLFRYVPEKYQKLAGVYLLMLAGILVILNSNHYNEKITTPRGTIYTSEGLGKASNELISYINENTKPDERVVIFPEGMIINFLADRKGDDYYNSLIPLYVETFGEDKIVEHFVRTRPEYIVFSDTSMKDYSFNTICNDYALGLCSFTAENYTLERVIDHGNRFLVYKRK